MYDLLYSKRDIGPRNERAYIQNAGNDVPDFYYATGRGRKALGAYGISAENPERRTAVAHAASAEDGTTGRVFGATRAESASRRDASRPHGMEWCRGFLWETLSLCKFLS